MSLTLRARSVGSALGILALVAGLGACASEPETTEQASVDTPEATLTFAIEGANLSAGHMDIHSSQLDVASLVLRNSFDSLVAQDASGEFVPWLAESWDISDDGLDRKSVV